MVLALLCEQGTRLLDKFEGQAVKEYNDTEGSEYASVTPPLRAVEEEEAEEEGGEGVEEVEDPVAVLLDAEEEESDGEESVYSVTCETEELSEAVARRIPRGFFQVECPARGAHA